MVVVWSGSVWDDFWDESGSGVLGPCLGPCPGSKWALVQRLTMYYSRKFMGLTSGSRHLALSGAGIVEASGPLADLFADKHWCPFKRQAVIGRALSHCPSIHVPKAQNHAKFLPVCRMGPPNAYKKPPFPKRLLSRLTQKRYDEISHGTCNLEVLHCIVCKNLCGLSTELLL